MPLDKAAQDDLKAKINAASGKLDGILTAMAKGPDAAKAKDFQGGLGRVQEDSRQRNHSAHLCRQESGGQGSRYWHSGERMKKMKGVMGCQ